MNQKKVLGVIGLGHVGAHVAYSLAVQGIADELVLVDGNAQKLAAKCRTCATRSPIFRTASRSAQASSLTSVRAM